MPRAQPTMLLLGQISMMSLAVTSIYRNPAGPWQLIGPKIYYGQMMQCKVTGPGTVQSSAVDR